MHLFYSFVEHELTVGRIAKEVGFEHVSLSHDVMPMVKIVPRGYTACADAYLTPHIKKYIEVNTKYRYLYVHTMTFFVTLFRDLHLDLKII